MGKHKILQRLIFLPIIGLLFALFFTPITPVSAIPQPNLSQPTNQQNSQDPSAELLNPDGTTSDSSTTENNPSNNSTTENSTQSTSCYETVGALGWIICPVTSTVAAAVDSLYDIINNFLVIKPISFNENSSTYIVWSTARDIANILFIILILVVIFSQLTGIGFDNYSIKKTLPRIIIAAILVNLSFIICSLAVDASNIIGASTKNFFDSVTETIKSNQALSTGSLSWSQIIGQILGTATTYAGGAAIAAGAIALTGGLGHFIWIVLPLVFGAVISLAIGLLTITLRQAVVTLLVMIAPLAFVAYLLPNTEQYFKKWKDILIQMLIFYPLFALLYGASSLAGWTFITNGLQNGSAIEVIAGMAIQVFPLIASFKLLKMSDTILGKVSDTFHNLSQPIRNTISTIAARNAATAKAQYDASAMSRNYQGLAKASPAHLRSYAARRQAILEENRRLAESRRQTIMQTYVAARSANRNLTFDQNGRMVLSDQASSSTMNSTMKLTMQNKEASLNNASINLEVNNALSQPNAYAKLVGINDRNLSTISARQADNFLDLKTQTNAKRRNDLGDEQFYATQVLKASQKSADSEDYQRLITKGAGVNAHDQDPAIKNSALTSVIANAYDITEAERMGSINRLSTFFNTQPTEKVEADLKTAMENHDVNSIMAGLNTLDNRGDGDKVAKYVREYMDAGNLKLGTEYANNLAKSMLNYSENQLLKGVGKMINVETLAFTEGRRTNDTITFKEFITGEADFDVLDKTDPTKTVKYKPKYDVISTTRGKNFATANRTTMKAYMEAMAAYDVPDMEQRILELDDQLRPQLVSAIPTYNSGSEEILAAAKYLTGMVQDGKGDWIFDGTVELPNGQKRKYRREFFLERTKKYLSAFTPGDLVKMKSDILGATKRLFADGYLSPDLQDKTTAELKSDQAFKALFEQANQDAKTDFQAIFDNTSRNGNGAMSTLLSGDLSTLGAMKKGLRDMLDLNSEDLETTLEKYGINNKKK